MASLLRPPTCSTIPHLLDRNKIWARRTRLALPALFPRLAREQTPQILWIGCSDSRVPETHILDLLPGELFVHRNIANLLPENDISSRSVVQYAVDILKVKHVIVCGHYGCGGIAAAMERPDSKLGVVNRWLKHIREVKVRNWEELQGIRDLERRAERLVELNVLAQVQNLKRNWRVKEAVKERGLEVHGFVYNVGNGYIDNLEIPTDPAAEAYELERGGGAPAREMLLRESQAR